MEAISYFENKVDPFQDQKDLGLTSARGPIEALTAQLQALAPTFGDMDDKQVESSQLTTPPIFPIYFPFSPSYTSLLPPYTLPLPPLRTSRLPPFLASSGAQREAKDSSMLTPNAERMANTPEHQVR